MEPPVVDANEMTAANLSLAPPPPPAAAKTARGLPSSTKRHWRVLRNALLAKTRDETTDSTASSVSTEFFPQFTSELLASPHKSTTHVPTAAVNFEWRAYSIKKKQTNGVELCKRVLVHEKLKRQKVSLAELFSHKLNDGVDNTGNIRMWPSEQVLLSYVLRNETYKALAAQKGSKIQCCELGGGMTGLASLGLVAHGGDFIERMLVTDGNPQSVANLKICIHENVQQGVTPTTTKTLAELLRWDRSRSIPDSIRHQFDLIFASDCLFFEEFHEDLAYTINALLRPKTGVCLLLQPSRNGSMERFRSIASSSRFHLRVQVVNDYDPDITRKHAECVASNQPEYVPDVHLPVLLQLRSIADLPSTKQ